ncbi:MULTISPECIES: NAD-dependent epimerase/dehydratase family protein [unclassified Minwuia]|jgi:nucleoside-diphosphate-sugar epimerase|uniref:NAD-dependent epimerase/dehydratase family protein n=1 Tax=unclassified Minwuia TaxID=2618799 RepID=UPI0024794227|nr:MULTISPECIES: NAD-dependent epimerase/dehydratase family protein [unclassified Minwuia]
MTRHILIIGATGGSGAAVAAACIGQGWQVTGLTRRHVDDRPATSAIRWVQGDAMQAADVLRAAQGVHVIFHGANPPGYRNWAKTAPQMLQNSIAAAQAVGARLILPGNIYNFGPDAFPVLREDAPQNPVSVKGAVRRQMEQMLDDACHQGMRALVLRAGDFFGPHAPASWLSNGMVRPGKPPRVVRDPGTAGAGHAWAYLPDFAETVLRLLQAEERLRDMEVVHMAGHWFDDGSDFARAVAEAGSVPGAKVKPLPWWLISALAPVVPLCLELREMRYLWQNSIALDNTRLRELIGAEPHTPLEDALRDTMNGLGCRAEQDQSRSTASTPAAI